MENTYFYRITEITTITEITLFCNLYMIYFKKYVKNIL